MGEPLSVWMVLVPIAALLTPFVVLPRFAELRDRQTFASPRQLDSLPFST